VRAYIDRSSGILTIRQMQWLAESVQRYGLGGPARTAGEYKALYLERLMVNVRARAARLAAGESPAEENMMRGSVDFLTGLASRGVRLYLASGTDHTDVVNEAGALGLLPFFSGGVYGALDHNEDHAKERVIQRILEDHKLSGDELLVIGDGPVEIREGAARGALTLGLASDEVARAGWNERKVERLTAAGADLLIADFSQAGALLAFLFEPDSIRLAG
jgi:phosphoglycolate phosphatase-like HAD superfamily hydrolase